MICRNIIRNVAFVDRGLRWIVAVREWCQRRESDVKEKTEQSNIGAVYGRIQMTERGILINQNSNIIDPIKKRDKGGRDDFVVNE